MAAQLILQFILILINAFFASAEMALITVNDTKMEALAQGKDKRAARARKILAIIGQPARFLATIQVGITLAGFLGSAFAADNFSERLTAALSSFNLPFPPSAIRTASLIIITIILSFLTLVLGELVPKRIAMKYPEQIAFAIAGVVGGTAAVFKPLVWLLTASTNGLLRLLRINPAGEERTVTEEEIRMMVDAGSEKGVINAGEKEIIHNIFEFDDRDAGAVMTHRTDVIFLEMDDDDAAWDKIIRENRYSFFPIYKNGPDDVFAVLNSREYLRLEDRTRENVMQACTRQPVFVPQSIKTDVLFRRLKKSRNHFVLVLDEYGGLSGIVTMNDLLEALLGDIDDDSGAPPERPDIEFLPATKEAAGGPAWRISGEADLDKVEESLIKAQIDIDLPLGDFNTFGGWVFSLLDDVPEDGWHGEITYQNLRIKIEDVQERQLVTALVVTNNSSLAHRAGEEKTFKSQEK